MNLIYIDKLFQMVFYVNLQLSILCRPEYVAIPIYISLYTS